jgi:hypothetical protein
MKQTAIRRVLTAIAATGLAAMPLTLAHASGSRQSAAPAGQKVVVSGLNGPGEIQFGAGGHIYVANRDNGAVVRSTAKGGHGHVIFTRIGSTGVAPVSATKTYVLSGEGEPGKGPNSALYLGNPRTGKYHKVASLLAFEKANNPDGQKQSTGKHADSVSNAYFLLRTTHDILIADAGANDIVAYRDGQLHTYHVFPNIRDTKGCKNARNNDAKHPGCDPVPTGMALGPDNTLYVSLLAAEAPNAARVVELDLQTGQVLHTFRHMSSVTGVAVSPSGVVYASELEFGLNPKAPNLAKTGRIIRIENGHRTYAHVATPSGLTWHDGSLYAASHSVDGAFAHIKNAGVVVKVAQSAFHTH